MRLKTKICKKEVKEYIQQRKNRKPAEQMGFSYDLLADHSRRIPFDPYGLSCIRAAAAPDRSGHLPCAAAVLLWGAVSVEALQKAKTVVLCTRTPASCRCREADAVFPRRISVRDQPLARYVGCGGNRKSRTVCGTPYTDADAVCSQSAVLQPDIHSLRSSLCRSLCIWLIHFAKTRDRLNPTPFFFRKAPQGLASKPYTGKSHAGYQPRHGRNVSGSG